MSYCVIVNLCVSSCVLLSCCPRPPPSPSPCSSWSWCRSPSSPWPWPPPQTKEANNQERRSNQQVEQESRTSFGLHSLCLLFEPASAPPAPPGGPGIPPPWARTASPRVARWWWRTGAPRGCTRSTPCSPTGRRRSRDGNSQFHRGVALPSWKFATIFCNIGHLHYEDPKSGIFFKKINACMTLCRALSGRRLPRVRRDRDPRPPAGLLARALDRARLQRGQQQRRRPGAPGLLGPGSPVRHGGRGRGDVRLDGGTEKN